MKVRKMFLLELNYKELVLISVEKLGVFAGDSKWAFAERKNIVCKRWKMNFQHYTQNRNPIEVKKSSTWVTLIEKPYKTG